MNSIIEKIKKLLRMKRGGTPEEVATAHSFPKSSNFTGNKEDQTKQIGNSVPVELACAHAEAALS